MSISTVDTLAGILQEKSGGLNQLDRCIYTDPDIFELEMEHIFEGTWLYLAHESQLPKPYDFITTYMGRRPVILNRDGEGRLQCFINSCAHRGAQVVNARKGNKKLITCPYHGWCYDAQGQAIDCGEDEHSAYPEAFDKKNFKLQSIAKVDNYRGFIFGSLNPNVVPLQEHLREATKLIDLFVDQTPDGKLEVIPGTHTYTYDGNWKLQAENGVDGYHVMIVHASYVQTVSRRREAMGKADPIKASKMDNMDAHAGGFYDFGNGHVAIWNEWPNPQTRPLYPQREQLCERLGEPRARWMTDYLRNMLIYPNVFFMDNLSTQIRIIRPISVDQTEVKTVCIGPANEDANARERRIRQYEDFFNASGMATPDDLAVFNESQAGFNGKNPRFSDLSRGASNLTEGPDASARELGVHPDFCGNIEGEGIYVGQYRRWLSLMQQGLERSQGVQDVT